MAEARRGHASRALHTVPGTGVQFQRVMGFRTSSGSLLIGIACAAVGCQKADSTDVRTAGIYAEFIVSAQSTTAAKVDASLWVGGPLSNTYLTLTGPDRLTTYVGSAAFPM